MIAFIRGTLFQIHPLYIIVDSSGIGYKIFIPPSLHQELPPLNAEILLFTSFVVRELSQSLYGFSKKQECDVFEALLNVSGIGPKIALSIIGHLNLEHLQKAVIEQDIQLISKVPGIGKKTAEKLLLEMRDRLPNLFAANTLSPKKDSNYQTIQDAVSALVNLGYSMQAAQKALQTTIHQHPDKKELSSLIKFALKYI